MTDWLSKLHDNVIYCKLWLVDLMHERGKQWRQMKKNPRNNWVAVCHDDEHAYIVGMYLSMYICPTVWSMGRRGALAVDRGPVPAYQWDRRRHFWESSPHPADYFPSGPKPRWSQNYGGGTLPTASPACNHNIQTLTFKHTTSKLCTFCDQTSLLHFSTVVYWLILASFLFEYSHRFWLLTMIKKTHKVMLILC